MPFKRHWDSSCPRVWDSWEDAGIKWVIQDLPPEDDEAAVLLLLEHLASDEELCKHSDMLNDSESMISMGGYWTECVKQRMSLACYAEVEGKRTLAALNCLVTGCDGEKDDLPEIEGVAWKNVFNAMKYVDSKVNVFQLLDSNTLLFGIGLVVKREYRGAKLGAKVLAAREPLCRALEINGTATVFTGISSQRSALRAGFTPVVEVTFSELADAGFNYPRINKSLKDMIKKFAP